MNVAIVGLALLEIKSPERLPEQSYLHLFWMLLFQISSDGIPLSVGDRYDRYQFRLRM